MYPEKMSLLPDDLFKNLIGTLEIGLAKYPFLFLLKIIITLSQHVMMIGFPEEICSFLLHHIFSNLIGI